MDPTWSEGPVARYGSADLRRLEALVAEHAVTMMRFIASAIRTRSVQKAWQEFTFGQGGQFRGDDISAELFYSWLRHQWLPDRKDISGRVACDVSLTRAFLMQKHSRLDPLLRRYLEACLASPMGFYEIVGCSSEGTFVARDVLREVEFEVADRLAAASLRSGEIVYAHVVPVDASAILEAIAPFSFPAESRRQLLELCPHRASRRRPLAPTLRRIYFALFERHLRPDSGLVH